MNKIRNVQRFISREITSHLEAVRSTKSNSVVPEFLCESKSHLETYEQMAGPIPRVFPGSVGVEWGRECAFVRGFPAAAHASGPGALLENP